MGYSEIPIPHCQKTKLKRKRRISIPEPTFALPPQVYQVAFSREIPKKKCRKKQTVRAHVTQTSCLTAIRDYVIKMRRPKRRKHKHHKKGKERDNAEKLIGSLKCDIQMISKYQQDIACHPEKVNSTDPFFVLSAMMCKMNKLEDLIRNSSYNERHMGKRSDMLITVHCIKKSIMEQIRCDEALLKEKQKKLCYLVKSLEIFERQIKCMVNAGKHKSSSPKMRQSPTRSKSCLCYCHDKKDCSPTCPGRALEVEKLSCSPSPCPPPPCPPPPCPPSPCPPPPSPPPGRNKFPLIPTSGVCDPCADLPPKYDITGVNLTYTKSSVHGGSRGKETEVLRNKMCCTMDENDDYKVTVTRGNNECPVDPCENSALKERLDHVSRLWLESARQLMDAFC